MGANPVVRRLTAILAADVVGYSRLMGADEEGTLARLKAHRRALIDPTIAAHRGRIVKTMGDGLLVEFASPVEALRCAAEVQQGMAARNASVAEEQRIALRIGINLGDVIAEHGDIHGDGVNVAARLQTLCPVGGVVVSGTVYDQVRDKLPLGFADLGAQSVKNIARPVQVYGVDFTGYAAPNGAPARVWPKLGVLAALTAGCLLLIAAGWWWLDQPSRPASPPVAEVAVPAGSPAPIRSAPAPPAPAPRLSIVVLPFANLSDDREQEYFADGITDDLTTDLSRIAGSFVISRNTGFTYKGRTVDPGQVGRELGVRYVLEGSIRRSGNQVRVNAQLIDAGTSAHLWADRFDSEVASLFELQNQITARIARSLDVALVEAEAQRAERERRSDPDAVDLAMRGWAIFNRMGPSRSTQEEVRTLFRQALERDPRLLSAWLGLAASYGAFARFSSTRDDDLRRQHEAITQALAIAPNNAQVHRALCSALGFERGRTADAILECQTAISLDPNDAQAHAQLGAMRAFLGDAEALLAGVEHAIRLSPRDPFMPLWNIYRGVANLHLGQIEQAVRYLRLSVQQNPSQPFSRLFLASALALAGQPDNARGEMAEFLRLQPGFTLSRFRSVEPSNHPAFLAQRQRVYEGLRLAGLPE